MVAGLRQNKTVHLYDLDTGVFLLLRSTGRGRIKGKGHRFHLSVDSGKVLEDIRMKAVVRAIVGYYSLPQFTQCV